MLAETIGIIVAIVIVDLALSGDNALVIGAVASRLPSPSRRNAIAFGGIFAAVFRIGLTFSVTLLLNIPYIKAIGGIIVLIIAYQLMRDIGQGVEAEMRGWRRHLSGKTMFSAIVAITLADISMSLDNILAIAALANGNYILLTIGLLLSIFFLLVASNYLAKLIERFPVLLYAAGLVLAWTAGTLIYGDHQLFPYIDRVDQKVFGPSFNILLPATVTILLIIAIAITRRFSPNETPQIELPAQGPISQPHV